MKSEARKKKLRYEREMTEAEKYQKAAGIANKLHACYPGHIWAVAIEGGTAKIQNLLLSGRMGFIVKLSKISPEMTEIMRAGGELLERYRQRRGWVQQDILAGLKRDIRGDVISYDR